MSRDLPPPRLWSAAEKQRIVDEARQPGATMADVARRHGVRGEDLYVWRRDAREGRLRDDIDTTRFVQVMIQDSAEASLAPACAELFSEMMLYAPSGDRLSFDARIDPALLSRVLAALRR